MTTIKPVKQAFKTIEPSVKREKNDIILLHGISCCKEFFDDIANDLADKTGRRVYALDARNHGDTEWSEEFNFEVMMADLINFMDEHDIESSVLIGHSMGGRLAMIMALKHPERVEKIIVEDMTPKALPREHMIEYAHFMRVIHESVNVIPPNTDFNDIFLIISEYIGKNKPKDVAKNAKFIPGKVLPTPIIQEGDKYTWKTNFSVIRKEILDGIGYCQNLEGLSNKPALFLYGTLAELNVGSQKDFILKLFPHAKFHGLDTSHNVHYECPEEYVDLAVKFLE